MTKDPWKERLEDRVGGVPRESHDQWARRIGSHLAEVDVAKLGRIHEECGTLPWHVAECQTGSGCWCRVIRDADGREVVQAGTLATADCSMIVTLHNMIPAICDLRELLEQPTWCGRCGRNDLRLWAYHSHIFSCMSTTDEEHEINQLKGDLEAANREIAQLREDLNAEIKDRGGKERTWGYNG